MRDPAELREEARWYLAAARNTDDPKLRGPMLLRAHDLSQLAETLSGPADGALDCAASGQGRNSAPQPA